MSSLEVKGAREIVRRLEKLGRSGARRAVRPAVRAALVPINKAAKRNLKRVTGSARASVGIKVKTYARSGTIFGAVGGRFPADRFARKFKGETRLRIGSFYLHILEFGSDTAVAMPFLRPALDEKRGEALRILNDKTIEGIEKQAARLRAGG